MSDGNFDNKVVAVIIEKLDVIQKDISDIKVEQAVIKTNMSRDARDKIPERLEKLEEFKSRSIGIMSVLMIAIPTVVSVLLKKVL